MPDDLINNDPGIGRSYCIAKLHNGKVTIIPCKFSTQLGMMSFLIDESSTYAIIVEDNPVADDLAEGDPAVDDPAVDDPAGDDLAEDSNPNTGVAVGGMFMAMLACGGLAVITSRKRKNK